MARLGVVHRLIAALVAASLVVSATGCRDGEDGTVSDEAPAPAGWQVQSDADLTIAVPEDWRYRRETSASGNEFVSLVDPEEVDGYPRAVVIGRTADVSEGDLERIVDLFRNVQGDRTFGGERAVEVEGARAAVLLESTRRQGDQDVPVRAWNVFALSPSSVVLNVEFVAPEAIFDAALFEKVLGTLVVRARGGADS